MAWQSDEIQPYSSSPADDIFKIQNDLAVVKTILEGGSDAEVAMALAKIADIGSMAGTYTSNTTSLTLTTSNIGKAGVFYGSAAAAWTLPAASAGSGKVLAIVNNSLKKLTLNTTGADTMTVDGQSATSLALQPGESIILVAAAGAAWYSLSYNRLPVDDIDSIEINVPAGGTQDKVFVRASSIKLYDDDGTALLCRSFSGYGLYGTTGLNGRDSNSLSTPVDSPYLVYLISNGVNFGVLLSGRQSANVYSGNTTAGSAVVTNIALGTASMRKGTRVRFSSYNSAYPEGEYRILSVDSSTQITLDTPAGVTGTSKQFRCDVAPTLPNGYTFYRKLGTIISSSDPAPLRFARTYQKGRNVIVSETSNPPCVHSTSNTASGVMPTGLLALLNNSNSIRSVTVSFSFFQTTAGTTASSAYATFAGKNYYVVQGVLPVYYTTARFTFDNMACVNATTNGPLSQSLTLGTGASAILTSSLHEWEEDLRA